MTKKCDICQQPISFMGEYYFMNKTICKKCNKKLNDDDIDDIKDIVEKIKLEYEEMNSEKDINLEMNEKIKDILVSTLPDIKNRNIIKYFDMISKEVFIGTGFLSEFSASLDDLFGTRSTAFSDKISEAKKIALNELKLEASKLGANAVIGAEVEYMITANNMLMFSVVGTPVLLETME